MIIARKIFRNLIKEKVSAIKIQRKFRKFRKILKFKRLQQLNLKKLEPTILTKKPSPIKEAQNKPILPNPYEILNQNKPTKDQKEKEKNIQKQKESIRHLYEPALKKMNTAKIRLQKIQSNKDLEENHPKVLEKKLSKKGSNPIMIKDNSIEIVNNNSNNDSFSNKMNNTKKINNLLATSNNVINNLTRIYGGGEKKKENKRMKTLEDQNINDLFTFFHKKLNK